MLNNNLIKKYAELDEIVEEKADGVYVLPSRKDVEIIKIRDLIKHCKNNSKDISKISNNEVLLFCE